MIEHWHNIQIALNTDDYELLLEVASNEGFEQEGVTPEEMKEQLIHLAVNDNPLFYKVLRTYCALRLKSTIERMK